MTPDEVLEAFRAMHALLVDAGDACPCEIRFAMTVDDWCDALDVDILTSRLHPGSLAEQMNSIFGATTSTRHWRVLLRWRHRATLRTVCRLIARRTSIPAVESVQLLGRACLPAGAFLAIRRALADAGINTRDIRPSTPLQPVLRRHHETVFRVVNWRLAGGRLPFPDTKSAWFDMAVFALLGAGVLMLILALPVALGWPDMAGILGAIGVFTTLAAALLLLPFVMLLRRPPRWARWGAMRSFGDLARRVADVHEKRQGGNTAFKPSETYPPDSASQ
jgi:hypothetical protein